METTPQPTPAQPSSAQATYGAELDGMIRRLVMLRRIAKAMLIGETASWLGAVWVAGGIAVALTDYFLRMPGWLRGGWLGAGAAVAAWLLWHRVFPALRFRPNLTEFALRVERSEAGKRAGLEGVLASAVDMAMGRGEGSERTRAALVMEAAKRSTGVGIVSVLRPGRIVAALCAAACMALLVLGLFAARPTLATIGSLRILAPWSAAEWPRRTNIETAVVQKVHALGQTFALRAALLGSDVPAEQTRVEARYRIIDSKGTPGPTRRVALTCQDKGIEVPTIDPLGKAVTATGTLFERLIEPAALEPGENFSPDQQAELEFWLTSEDDQTAPQRVLLVRPPQVVAAAASVTPPAYLGGEPARAELGPGTDERATVPAVLRGSRVALDIGFNKPINPPEAGKQREWTSVTLGEQFAALVADQSAAGDDATDLKTELNGNHLTLTWTVRDSVRLPVRPVDQHGIASDGESVFRIESREDRPPEATVTRPSEDIEALPSATIDIAAEARDDVVLDSVAAQWRLARKPAGSEGAGPEPIGEETTLIATTAETGKVERVLVASAKLEVGSTGATPGDELWISALAKDRFELGGKGHEGVRSATRRVKIISREQLVEQVWSELGAVRRSTIRMAEQQDQVRQGLNDGKDRPGASRDEAAISDAANHQSKTVQRLSERLKSNALQDQDLSPVLQEAAGLLEQAKQASASAAADIRKAEEAKAAGKDQEASKAKAQAQPKADQAQRSLEQLAELLDKGEDAWSVRRGIERLIEDQKQLRQQTAKLGEQTTGKSTSELSPQQQQRAGQLSDQQQDLAQRAEEVMNRLQQAAEQMQQQDPAGAQALQDAARKAEKAKLQPQLEQAAKDIKQNRQQSATQQQDRAVKALEDVLDQMQQAAKSRDEVLERELASLVESLETLIKKQEAELAALTTAQTSGSYADLDKGMISLRQNTLAVMELARAAGREVVTLIEAAGSAQGDAATALRAEPVDAGSARTGEELSLAKLKEARDRAEEARKKAEDRNEQRKRAELKKAYRELLDSQLDVRAKTKDVSTMEEGRRKRAAARDLSPSQDQIRQKAVDLGASTAELAESDTFGYAQKRLEEALAAAATRLGEGEADRVALNRQNAAIRVLQSILEALAEADKTNDDLREQSGGDQSGSGQSGGQAQGLIPQGAELKLLRSLQSEALNVTREAAESGDVELSQEASALQKALLQRAKAVLEKLQQQGGGGPGMRNGPKDEPDAKPEPGEPEPPKEGGAP